MVPQRVVLSMKAFIEIHACIALVYLERGNIVCLYDIMIMCRHHGSNNINFSLYCTFFKLCYIEMTLAMYSTVEKIQGKCFFKNLFQAYVVLAYKLAYSYIECTDAT